MSGPQSWFDGRVSLFEWPVFGDARGRLQAFDFAALPFVPARVFAISGVPAGTVRGEHGHRHGTQLLVCLQGRIEVLMRHRSLEAELVLVPDGHVLSVAAGVWCRQTYVEAGSVLLVLASEAYSPESYFTEES